MQRFSARNAVVSVPGTAIVFAGQIARLHRFAGDDHRAVVVAHAGAAGAESVLLSEVGVAVQADRRQFEFS